MYSKIFWKTFQIKKICQNGLVVASKSQKKWIILFEKVYIIRFFLYYSHALYKMCNISVTLLFQLLGDLRMSTSNNRFERFQLLHEICIGGFERIDLLTIIAVFSHEQLDFSLQLVHVFFLFSSTFLCRNLQKENT